MVTVQERIEELLKKRKQARLGGGPERIARQHAAGKYTAWERLEMLVDKGSFIEFGRFVLHRATEFGMDKRKAYGDGVITGLAEIGGRKVAVYFQDFTFMGGSVGEMHATKIARTIQLALKLGIPIVGINDSGGARIQEGVDSLKGYGEIFYWNVMASGVVPQIVAIMGPCAGGAVYSPALSDFIVMTEKSFMFITGPKVVKAATGEEVSFEELGGAHVHATRSGMAHFVAKTEEEAFEIIRKLLSYLPSNNVEDPPYVPPTDDPQRMDEALDTLVPDDPGKPYDMKEIIARVVDDGDFLEVHQHFAQNLIVGFARLDGHPVGIVAQQPMVLAGVIDIDASDKGARFIRFCDCFNIPLVTFCDTPGYMPGVAQEHGGIIRHGAKMLYAYAEATVPKVAVITRKAYGGAYIVMSSKHLRGDINLAWPSAEIAVMGPEGAVNVVFRRDLKAAEDTEARRAELVQEYRDKFANPYVAAARGYLDAVIAPHETRPRVIAALRMLENKRDSLPPKKHGNIPL